MRIHGEFSVMYYCFGTWKSIAIFALCSVQSSFFFFPNAVEDEWDLKPENRKFRLNQGVADVVHAVKQQPLQILRGQLYRLQPCIARAWLELEITMPKNNSRRFGHVYSYKHPLWVQQCGGIQFLSI